MTLTNYTQAPDDPWILRARKLDEIDMLLNTALEARRSLTVDEQRKHDRLVTDAAVLERQARSTPGATRAAGQYGMTPPPMVTSGTEGFEAIRSLDAILWATAETVRCGSVSDKGNWMPNQAGAVANVDRAIVRSEGFTLEAPRITEFAPVTHDAVRNFQQTVAEMCIFGLLVDKHAFSSGDGFEVARSHAQFKDRWNHALRALDVDTSGEGGTWVPTGIGATLHEKVRAAGKVAPLFTRIDLPTNPWKWPIEGGDAAMYRVAEPTSDTATKMSASTPGTVAPTFDAEIFGGRTLFSRSVDADSAVAVTPFVTNKLVRAFVDAEEKTILDGDTDGTHQDSDVQAIGSTDPRTAWDGLRKKALAQTSQATTTTSAANILAIRASMGKWGVNPDDCAVIMGVSAYYDILGDSNVLTLDKLGPNATILNGQLASIHGMPIIVSEHVREDLNASGVHDGITETKSYTLVVNRNEWAIGQRMALDVEVDDSIYRETYQRVAVAFQREDFQHIGDAATNDDTAIGYNLTP